MNFCIVCLWVSQINFAICISCARVSALKSCLTLLISGSRVSCACALNCIFDKLNAHARHIFIIGILYAHGNVSALSGIRNAYLKAYRLIKCGNNLYTRFGKCFFSSRRIIIVIIGNRYMIHIVFIISYIGSAFRIGCVFFNSFPASLKVQNSAINSRKFVNGCARCIGSSRFLVVAIQQNPFRKLVTFFYHVALGREYL